MLLYPARMAIPAGEFMNDRVAAMPVCNIGSPTRLVKYVQPDGKCAHFGRLKLGADSPPLKSQNA